MSRPSPKSQDADRAEGQDADGDGWQVVDFPNRISIHQIPGTAASSTTLLSNDHSSPSKPMNQPNPSHGNTGISPEREAELVTLIRDLNECNDVLLAKVSQLEEALDRSQSALQSEIERSQNNSNASDKSGEPRVSDRHIAQLVTELEYSNQALKRHQLLNETLQTELTLAQERVDQLEHDYAVTQQQYADQSQSLLQSETACRDLRSRLQRQQRYTMQFKAALEKCLNVSANAHTVPADFVTVGHVNAGQDMPLVSMPKAQHIQPWVSESGDYQKLDPQLESLIRGSQSVNKADEEAAVQPIGGFDISTQPMQSAAGGDPAAEAQLWHDLARMIENPTGTLNDADEDFEGADDDLPLTEAAFVENASLQFTEPSPWETPLASEVPTSNVHVPEPRAEIAPEAAPEIAPEAAPEIAPETLSEMPSRPEVSVEVLADASSYVPAMTFPEGEAAPSPVVSPLRSQKRIKSLAAVELPNFPKPQPRPKVAQS
ncbi:MAG: hypothetical protein AAGC54_03315 [Cyanobacteria bacterium P01_F01_bin.4]